MSERTPALVTLRSGLQAFFLSVCPLWPAAVETPRHSAPCANTLSNPYGYTLILNEL